MREPLGDFYSDCYPSLSARELRAALTRGRVCDHCEREGCDGLCEARIRAFRQLVQSRNYVPPRGGHLT